MAVSLIKSPIVKTPSMHLGGGSGVGLNIITIYAALQLYKSAAAYPMSGPAFDSLAWSIANAVDVWIDNPLNVTMVGLATGTVGVGAISPYTTRLFCLPVVPLMQGSLVSAGVQGPLASSLATIVTLAIAHAVTQFGGYMGVCPTVGVGTDASKVVVSRADPLVEEMVQSMKSYNITGAASPMLAAGLGTGIASLILTAFGTGKVMGPPSVLPSTGPSFSKVG